MAAIGLDHKADRPVARLMAVKAPMPAETRRPGFLALDPLHPEHVEQREASMRAAPSRSRLQLANARGDSDRFP
ncbi:MAG: hypothetical protein R3202_10600, partial [Candidatus Competibacterales bacterium]|nr:hypothetical protein [Candidatus Competibacterales bacterium]